MQRITTLLLFFIFEGFFIYAQSVETLNTSEPISCDDMFVDASGIIYTGKGGLSNKTDLGRIMPDGTTTSVGQGMSGPISIIEAPDGLLYVTNYDDNSIKSYNRITGEVKTVATGLDGPSGIAINSKGEIYASNWGGPPAYNGRQIHRLNPDGSFEVFKTNPFFSRLQGIAFDDQDQLYVANTQDGKIFKINTETGDTEILVTIGLNIVNMEFHDGYFYMASIKENKIIKMDLNGVWSTFAGTGISGGKDGPVETATFNNPIGVGFSPTGDTLYVSDSPNRLRRIVFNNTSPSSNQESFISNILASPNPSSALFKINLSDNRYLGSEIDIVDIMGKVIYQGKIEASELTLDLSDQPNGYYFLVVRQDGLINTLKLKKE